MKYSYTITMLLLLTQTSFCQKNSSGEDWLINSTIRIKTIELKNGKEINKTSLGTGFFYDFSTGKKKNIPVIITNRHVIEKGDIGVLHFSLKDSTGNKQFGKLYKLEIKDFKSKWILHPDSSIDLACLPIQPILDELTSDGIEIYYKPISEKLSLPPEKWKKLNVLEEVIMIGYPLGLWDYVNNSPLISYGVTATSPRLNYLNRPEFLVNP